MANNNVFNCIGKEKLIVLGEVVIKQYGCYRLLRRYVQGQHPELGSIFVGHSGNWETVWDVDVILPMITVDVALQS
jgi:hypothetical protein